MVHVFECRGHYYIFDTGSSALHECDEKAARLLRARLGEDADVSDISDDERRAYEEDFAELERGGLLFAPETKARPIKSDEVKASACTSATTATFAAATASRTRAPIIPAASS